jgi:hypothetical protein
MRLDMHSRQEIYRASWREYQKAGKKERGEILGRLVKTTGINRDYLATVLRNYGKDGAAASCGKAVKGKREARPGGKRGGRPKAYGERFAGVLEAIWREHGRMCGKLLVPMIREIIDFLVASKHPDYRIDDEIRALLLRVSPAAADRILRKARKADEIRGISTTRAAQVSLRSQVPVQTHYDRKTITPGFFAFDTVAHCGGAASGQFCKTLTGTDVYSGWVEERPLLNAANRWVKEAFSNIEGELPFPLKGAHFDNGVEFINKPLLEWCLQRSIEPTRSRPYKKNDNCFAEQKNFDAVRKTVGYFRFDTPAEKAALAEVYRYLSPLYNYWYPSFRLIDKVKQADGHYRKVYEKQPKTPCQRLLDSPDISGECKAELRRRKALYNPSVLNTLLNAAVEHLLRINREKGQDNQTPCQGDTQPDAA